MPQPRFVEIVDVAAEASSTIASLLAAGQGLAGKLSFNISDYINSTNPQSLIDAFAKYNITTDALPTEYLAWAESINLTNHTELVPAGRARHYLLMGLAILAAREMYVRVRTKRLLRQHGIH